MSEAAFRPEEILEVLARHEVEYVLIGGLAATLHGAAYVTVDLDITPSTHRENLDRLSAALRDLDAKVRSVDAPDESGLPFDHAGESLARARVWNLTTSAGNLDICVEPAGTSGYEDLRRDAVTIELGGARVKVASLADVVRSKEAAGREKDRLALPMLRRLLEAQRRGST
jgi:hypothetical protein